MLHCRKIKSVVVQEGHVDSNCQEALQEVLLLDNNVMLILKWDAKGEFKFESHLVFSTRCVFKRLALQETGGYIAAKLEHSWSQSVQRKFELIYSKWTQSTLTEEWSIRGSDCLELEAAGQMVSYSLSGRACEHTDCQWHSPQGK